MKKVTISLILIFSILINFIIPCFANLDFRGYVEKESHNSLFSFKDLEDLTYQAMPMPHLKERLDSQLSKVYIHNQSFPTKMPQSNIRFGLWNIHRGFNIEEIKNLFLHPEAYRNKYISNVPRRLRKDFNIELNNFSKIEVISLNEADIGMPRTEYKNTVTYLANALGWNYAYATEFVELGPIFQKHKIDKKKYLGLHANAIISKYPIVSARVIQLPNFYDWYGGESEARKSPVEYLRYGLAMAIFSEHIEYKEVRHGSRNLLIADIKLPNNKIITVVNTHLEDRAYPDQRLKQFEKVLSHIKNIKTPVVLCGDFNTSTTDSKPTSLKKEWVKRARDIHFIVRTVGTVFIPGLPFVYGMSAITFSKLLQYKDPFFPSVFAVFPNHERGFYTALRKFRFSDGTGFDLSGSKDRSCNGKAGLLANSNQRHWKGFKSTYKFEKPRIIAYFKLDWFFIKPKDGLYYPSNARTLKTLNKSYKGCLSDHNPITVDIKI